MNSAQRREPLINRIGYSIVAAPRRLAFALRFFTRIPHYTKLRMTSGDIARSSAFFPIVGLIEGAFVVAAVYVGSRFDEGIVAAAFCLAFRLAVSRGPIKNMAHAFDGLCSSRNRLRMVQIMFDNQYGTMAVAAVTLDIAIKYALYYEIISRLGYLTALPLLACSCMSGKLCVMSGIATTGSVFGVDKLIDDSQPLYIAVGAIFTFAMTAILMSVTAGVFMMLVEIPMGIILSGLIAIKLGGITKQTLGIMHEVGEAAFIFIMLVWG